MISRPEHQTFDCNCVHAAGCGFITRPYWKVGYAALFDAGKTTKTLLPASHSSSFTIEFWSCGAFRIEGFKKV